MNKRANVLNLSPLLFIALFLTSAISRPAAAAGDPAACSIMPAVTIGSVIAGQLGATDCATGTGDLTRLADRYTLTLATPTTVSLSLSTTDFQPLMTARKGVTTSTDPASLLGVRALASPGKAAPQYVLPAGDYTVSASTRQSSADNPPSGAYSLAVTSEIQPQQGCAPIRGATFVTFNSEVTAAISDADCVLPARDGVVAGATPRYIDQYSISLTSDRIAHLKVEADFDYRIEHWIAKNNTSVMDGVLTLVKAGQEKLLVISDSADATHTVILAAINPGETGAYSMDFSDYKQNQRDALISFYNATNGASWNNKSNWLGVAGSECTWFGVTCEDGMVTSLDLNGNGLTGTIPSQLRMLSDLSTLSLANNKLTGSIPAELGTLELSGLFLQNNQLSGAVPSALLTMSTLSASNFTGNAQLTQPLLNTSERTALLAFYSATGGDNWTNKTGWGGAVGTECSWYGITCIGGYVTAINFPATSVANVPVGNGLVGTLPAALSGLPNLRNLSLTGNQLSGTIPAEVWKLTELRTLLLGFNQLTGTLPPAVGNLTNLVNLLLYNNALTGPIPVEVGALSNLTSLQLFSNQFSGTIPAQLGNLTQMLNLNLRGNQLTGSIPPELGKLTKMLFLSLGGNQLTGAVPAELGSLINLSYLHLQDNQLTGQIPAELGNLVKLITLNMPGNQLSGSIPPQIGSIATLTTISLQNNQLSGAIPASFATLPALTSIDVTGNKLDRNALVAFYDATGGDNWTNKTNWLGAPGTECTWYGVGCSSGVVTSLNFPANFSATPPTGNNLVGTLPVELAMLTELRTLYLAVNQLSGTIPAELGALTKLQTFSVLGNQLSGTIPVELGNLKELTFLSLGDNNLTGTIPVELASLPKLQTLKLFDNQLTGTIPPELANLSQLQVLELHNNLLSGTVPPALAALSSLTTFNYNGNTIIPFLVNPNERTALMAFFNATGGNTWTNKTGWGGAVGTECSWYGVGCGSGHVTSLNFPTTTVAGVRKGNGLSGTLPPEIGNLVELNNISLDANELSGVIPSTIGNLTKLTSIAIGSNKLSGAIPPEIGTLTQLKHLYLYNNQLTGTIPDALGNLQKLERLHLHTNRLTGTIPGAMWQLAALKELSLERNQLSGVLSTEIGNLQQLTLLHLFDNLLSGPLPTSIGNLTKLISVNLGNNDFTGEFPGSISNLTNLTSLSLYGNLLTGTIPAALGNLQKLERLHLHTNQLTGTIPGEIWQLIALKELSLERNQLTGALPTEIGNLQQLTLLHLSDNLFSGPLPASIGNLTKLTSLILANNDFTGEIPAAIGQLTELTHLSLPSNQLTGSIPSELANLTKLTSLYLNHNQLTGVTPAWISTLPLLVNLNLDGNLIIPALANPAERDALIAFYNATGGESWTNKTGWGGAVGTECSWYGVRCGGGHVTAIDFPTVLSGGVFKGNGLVGTLPVEITTLTHLTTLKLNSNQLSGTIPAGLWAITSLTDLQLATNQLTGQIPPAIGNLVNLRSLLLNANQFSGPLPAEIANLTKLTNLTLSNFPIAGPFPAWIESLKELTSLGLNGTQLTGAIPEWIGNLSKLTSLQLSGNQLTGGIPSGIGSLVNLISLNLSANQLSGEIPVSIGNLTKLTNLQLPGNQLTGGIPPSIDNLVNLTLLNLAVNQLSGAIPVSIGNLVNLTALNLYSNQLTGGIPSTIGNLTKLTTLNLFSNQLSGGIPSSLGDLVNLTSLSLSGNQLTGEIPASIGNLTKLTFLFLYDNQLSGPIPSDIAKLLNLRTLSLFSNDLSGAIPVELSNLKELTFLGLADNNFTGTIPVELASLSKLQTLRLLGNQLTGPIPAELANLGELQVLELQNNQLSGPLPIALGTLSRLTNMSLGGNKLTGAIPPEFTQLAKLDTLLLNDNLLTGTVPAGLYDLPLLTSLDLFGNTLDDLRVGDIAACENLTSVSLGDVVAGVLDRSTDCFTQATQRLTDHYSLTLSEQTAVTLTATATEFQALTGVAAASSPYPVIGTRGAQEETTATAQFLLPAGDWRLLSSTQQSNPHSPPYGPYSFTVTGSAEPQRGCMPSTYAVIGSVARGTLANGDCVGKPLPTEGEVTRYMDRYAISLPAGVIAKVTLEADIDVTFEWWTNDSASIASIPLTTVGKQAVFQVTADSAATHTLVVLAANHEATGAYTMTFSPGTAPSEPEPEPEPEPEVEPTPVPVPDTGTAGSGGSGTEGSGTGGSGTGGTGTGGTGTGGTDAGGSGTGGTDPDETPITQAELTESITSIEGALDAIAIVAGTAPSEETLTQVTNALDQADNLAQQLITALPEGTAGVSAALDALQVINNTLSITGDVTQEGGVVSQDAIVSSLGNVADLLTTLSSRSDVITAEQQEAVQNLATAAVENSANLILSTTTTDELVQLVSAVSDVINAAAQAGGTLTPELVDQAEELTSKAITTGLNQFSEGIDVSDAAAVANVLRTNPDALQFALEASVILESRNEEDSGAVAEELAALGLSEEDSERLSANVLGSVANPDGVSVGGVSATDALINALSQLLSGATAQGLSQTAVSGLVAQALSDTDAKVQVNAATGVMVISLPGQKFYGAAVNIRLVPASVPAGISYMRDGRGVLVANGLAIELAPVSANVLAFASSVQKQGFAMTMRNNGTFGLNLGGGQRFSGAFAYDNLQAMTGTCAAPEFVTPQGAANDPGYTFGVRCEAGVEQRIVPFMEDPAFYQTASSGGLNVSTDRNTGIISIATVGRFKPSFFVSVPSETDKTWLSANKNAHGVALRAAEANGDGIADFEFVSAAGVQLLLGVRP